MKKSFLSIGVLVLSLAMSMMFLCSQVARAQSSGNKFIYDKNDSREIVYTLDESGKFLTPKLKYEFEKDNAGNNLSKTAYRWNKQSGSWKPYYLVTFIKEGKENVMEYGQWNEATGDFTINIQKTVYAAENDMKLTSYVNYQWNAERTSWLVQHYMSSEQYLASSVNF